MNPSDYPFCVWEQRLGGLFLRFFPDEARELRDRLLFGKEVAS